MPISRRRALTLASFFVTSPLLGRESRAESLPVPGAASFDMATFSATSGGDADAAFAKALARRAVLAWDGIGDADGNPIDPSPEAIDALLDVWPIFEAFQLTYVSKGLLLEQEKNASALSPNGPSAGASDTATPARRPARTARRG